MAVRRHICFVRSFALSLWFLVLFVSAPPAGADDVRPFTAWSRAIGGGIDDSARSVCVGTDNSIVVGGESDSFTPIEVGYIVKLDEEGQVLWQRTLEVLISVRSVVCLSDGSIAAVGSDLVVWLDADGNVERSIRVENITAGPRNAEPMAFAIGPGDIAVVTDAGLVGVTRTETHAILDLSGIEAIARRGDEWIVAVPRQGVRALTATGEEVWDGIAQISNLARVRWITVLAVSGSPGSMIEHALISPESPLMVV